jgi:hypothetical protein
VNVTSRLQFEPDVTPIKHFALGAAMETERHAVVENDSGLVPIAKSLIDDGSVVISRATNLPVAAVRMCFKAYLRRV